MDEVARLGPEQRLELFNETAARMGLLASLVEKDFWVCWTLRRIFSLKRIQDQLLFKGGTSLSKVFGLIQRFSEDIDLTIDRGLLGLKGLDGDLSGKQRRIRLEEMRTACDAYLAGDLLPMLRKEFSPRLPDDEDWSLEVDASNGERILFAYPPTTQGPAYVQQRICLEFGIKGEFSPHEWRQVESYAAGEFPHVFKAPSFQVRAMSAERTFWEKATILHQEHHRGGERAAPDRYARHYYDLYMMAQSPGLKVAALKDSGMLKRVVEHKKTYFPCAWAKYDLAVPASLRLLPNETWAEHLKRDYEKMQPMFFGVAPAWEEILSGLAALEAEIRNIDL